MMMFSLRSWPVLKYLNMFWNVVIGLDVTGENGGRRFKMRWVVKCANFDDHR
ncbi:MAG: hypothetical protein ACJAXG_000995, partial [Celeribacter sp.]